MINKLKICATGALLLAGIIIAGSDGDMMPLNQLIGAGMLLAAVWLSGRCEL
ncbi:MAG: hypothetical protein HGJ94_17240 [Desulfosarcina sp.]|nr:hypothetical protein [Desulfosarcina sp.]MBC2742114.1 hypothetical protein [Desulfosarcina sp.]MBC2765027.1 hypothetical protein [Desulfosarcina sp.]